MIRREMKSEAAAKGSKQIKVESCDLIFDGRVFSVTRDSVIRSDGHRVVRDVVRHAGSAIVVPRRDDGRVLLIRQFRMPVRCYLWETVAGRLDAGETPLEAAKRELGEETGFSASRWTPLAEFYPSPGFLDERMHLFLAEGVKRGRAHPEADEQITARWFTLDELGTMIQRGKILDAKTLVAFFMLRSPKSRFRASAGLAALAGIGAKKSPRNR